MVTVHELEAAMIAVAGHLDDETVPEGDRMVGAARELSKALATVVRDAEFWTSFVDDGRLGGKAFVSLAMAIDWELLLKKVDYRPPPAAEILAGELIGAALADPAAGPPPPADILRDNLARLSSLLKADADTPQRESRTWLRRVGDRIASGFRVLKLVSFKKVLTDVVEMLNVPLGTFALAGSGLGAVLAPIGMVPLIGTAPALVTGIALPLVVRAAWSTGREIARVLEEREQEAEELAESKTLRRLYQHSWIMNHTEVGRFKSKVEFLVKMVENRDSPKTVVDDIRTALAQAATDVSVAWGALYAHAGEDAARWATGFSYSLLAMRTALRKIELAAETGEMESAFDGALSMRKEIENFVARADSLTTYLQSSKLLIKSLAS